MTFSKGWELIDNVSSNIGADRSGFLRVRKGPIPRALFLGEMRNISPVSFELRLLE